MTYGEGYAKKHNFGRLTLAYMNNFWCTTPYNLLEGPGVYVVGGNVLPSQCTITLRLGSSDVSASRDLCPFPLAYLGLGPSRSVRHDLLTACYQYRQPIDSKSIRLLKFNHEGFENSESISCTLEVFDFGDLPNYHACSYTWSDPNNERAPENTNVLKLPLNIYLQEKSFSVTPNLYDALSCYSAEHYP
jgi:hypothetical protein